MDPPYNTQSAFEHYDDNLEHAQWLTMMLPRLQLLRELLREDGSIWVTIDDHEGHYLKVLMDEVFGRGNFVATVIWQKTLLAAAESARDFSCPRLHPLLFTSQGAAWKHIRKLLPRSEEAPANYSRTRTTIRRGPWRLGPISAQAEQATP
ncbi:MAG: DNA methyltransferase [Ottowia sp.]